MVPPTLRLNSDKKSSSFQKELEFCKAQEIDFFWEPSPYPEFNVPPVSHRMVPREDKEHNSISIISFD
jgi:hypothetical protein